MKHSILFLFLFFVLNTPLFAQKTYNISFEDERISDFDGREFFIETIVNKWSRDVFTYSKLNSNNVLTEIRFESDFKSELKFLLLKSLPEKQNQIGLTLIIENLQAIESYGADKNALKISFHAQLVLDEMVLYTNRYEKIFLNNSEYDQYPAKITEVIQGYLYDFAKIEEDVKENDNLNNDGKPTFSKEELEGPRSRNIIAVGYQIGGYNLIGIDYEIRATDVLGVHVGVGITGYTAGVKLHWKPTKDGGFVNVSYKDAGFGLMNGWAVEYGSKNTFGRREGAFGFYYQIGLALITNLDPDLKQVLGTTTDTPFPTLSVGVGVGW